MTTPNESQVVIEEIVSQLRPAPGVTLEQALADAQLAGYEALEVHNDPADPHAVIRWYKKRGQDG